MKFKQWTYFLLIIAFLQMPYAYSESLNSITSETIVKLMDKIEKCRRGEIKCTNNESERELLVQEQDLKYRHIFSSDGRLLFYYKTAISNDWPKANWPRKNWLMNNWKTKNWHMIEFDELGNLKRERKVVDNLYHDLEYFPDGTRSLMRISSNARIFRDTKVNNTYANPDKVASVAGPGTEYIPIPVNTVIQTTTLPKKNLEVVAVVTRAEQVSENIEIVPPTTTNQQNITNSEATTNQRPVYSRRGGRRYTPPANAPQPSPEQVVETEPVEQDDVQEAYIEDRENIAEEAVRELVDTVSKIADNEAATLVRNKYILLNHSSPTFDDMASSKEGAQNLLRIGREKNISIIGVTSPLVDELASEDNSFGFGNGDKYFFKEDQIDINLSSNGGAHKVDFINAEDIFLGGGHLSYCLCEAIRDSVRGSPFREEDRPLNLYIVKDATYDSAAYELAGIEFDNLDAVDVHRIIQSFFVPSFLCPNQNTTDLPNLKLSKVEMEVFLDDLYLDTYELEPYEDIIKIEKLKKGKKAKDSDLKQLINLRFIDSNDLEKYLDS